MGPSNFTPFGFTTTLMAQRKSSGIPTRAKFPPRMPEGRGDWDMNPLLPTNNRGDRVATVVRRIYGYLRRCLGGAEHSERRRPKTTPRAPLMSPSRTVSTPYVLLQVSIPGAPVAMCEIDRFPMGASGFRFLAAMLLCVDSYRAIGRPSFSAIWPILGPLVRPASSFSAHSHRMLSELWGISASQLDASSMSWVFHRM